LIPLKGYTTYHCQYFILLICSYQKNQPMNKSFEILNVSRNNMLNAVQGLSSEQLNKIPKGFNNNIIWNLGHVLVTQQLLNYKLSGLSCNVDDSMIQTFSKGTQPPTQVKDEEIDFIKAELVRLPQVTNEDYNKGIFKTFKAYPTSYGIELNNIEEAITFVNVHEGLHLGYIMALKRAVLSNS
jgi:hypothetical protein